MFLFRQFIFTIASSTYTVMVYGNILYIIFHLLYVTLFVLAVGKFFGFHYTDDSAMTLAIANSLIRQPAVAVDVHQFDAKDMSKGYTHNTVFCYWCSS